MTLLIRGMGQSSVCCAGTAYVWRCKHLCCRCLDSGWWLTYWLAWLHCIALQWFVLMACMNWGIQNLLPWALILWGSVIVINLLGNDCSLSEVYFVCVYWVCSHLRVIGCHADAMQYWFLFFFQIDFIQLWSRVATLHQSVQSVFKLRLTKTQTDRQKDRKQVGKPKWRICLILQGY
jgi:hypothetical protein